MSSSRGFVIVIDLEQFTGPDIRERVGDHFPCTPVIIRRYACVGGPDPRSCAVRYSSGQVLLSGSGIAPEVRIGTVRFNCVREHQNCALKLIECLAARSFARPQLRLGYSPLEDGQFIGAYPGLAGVNI